MRSSSLPRQPFALSLLVLLATACADRITPAELEKVATPEIAADGDRPGFTLLDCRADIAAGSVDCAPPAPERAEGMAFDERILGGQGRFVRLSSSDISYTDGIFSFDATVRNLTDTPMGTADGSERDDKGVRVFFQDAPSATSGEGVIGIANPTGIGLFTASDQPYFQFGGSIEGEIQEELGSDGILEPGEVSGAKRWELEVPASVESFAFTVLVSAEMPPGALSSIAPEITGISPAVLVPGGTATIAGVRFDSVPSQNSVTIGGVEAPVTGGDGNELFVTVPCVASGNVPVAVGTGSYAGAAWQHPLQASVQSVGVGEMVVIAPEGIACSELPATGEHARYIVSLFSNSSSPGSNAPVRFRGRGTAPAISPDLPPRSGGGSLITPDVSFEEFADVARQQLADVEHMWILEENNRVLEQFGARLRQDGIGVAGDAAVLADVSLNRTFRIPNIRPPAGSSFCRNYYVASATRVYYDGKLAIYEDDALSDAFKAANNPAMAQYYQQIGDQYNEDMEPIIHDYFGDVLRRDARTDNNGVMLVLFTPRINTSFSGVAGFVVTCDLFPNDESETPEVGGPYYASAGSSFASSNHGEIFYAYAPAVDGTGYGSGSTPDQWYRTIRSTFIHETKHLASYVARIENSAPWEATWLEEGTARHSEELWARLAVDPQPWRENLGYGSSANPVNIFCDARPVGSPECDANPRRPASIMQRHFGTLHTHLLGQNGRLLSPFGPSPSDNSSYYYAVSWSLVRYAVDRYALDEAAFFQALTQASETGVNNLLARAGVSLDELLAGWTLSLVVDDHPLWNTAPSADLGIATWNFRDIYRGLNSDFPGTYSLPFPQVPAAFGFGNISPPALTTLRGGGSVWYELSGAHTAPQLLWLEAATGGGPAPPTARMAITRVE